MLLAWSPVGVSALAAEAPLAVLIVVEQNGIRRLILDRAEPALDALQSAARRSTLALRLPQAHDIPALYVGDIWGDFTHTLRNAMWAYQTDRLLTGRIDTQPNQRWRARWVLYHEDRIQRWSTRADSLAMALAQGITDSALRLDPHPRPTAAAYQAPPRGITLWIHGVRNFQHYLHVENTLRGQFDLTPLRITPEAVAYSASIDIPLPELRRRLATLASLAPLDTRQEDAQEQAVLRYRLLP